MTHAVQVNVVPSATAAHTTRAQSTKSRHQSAQFAATSSSCSQLRRQEPSHGRSSLSSRHSHSPPPAPCGLQSLTTAVQDQFSPCPAIASPCCRRTCSSSAALCRASLPQGLPSPLFHRPRRHHHCVFNPSQCSSQSSLFHCRRRPSLAAAISSPPIPKYLRQLIISLSIAQAVRKPKENEGAELECKI
ncbi:hypothetical protein M0R45_016169 [Rubus argutus]|uniref:Uncharacterized protein n=1 Tax=Rubus argutus TaxID=59490 RepID=A0AAW1XSB7_RUBAR